MNDGIESIAPYDEKMLDLAEVLKLLDVGQWELARLIFVRKLTCYTQHKAIPWTVQDIHENLDKSFTFTRWDIEEYLSGRVVTGDPKAWYPNTDFSLRNQKERSELKTRSDRAAIVHNFINSATDFGDRQKVKALCGALDAANIPVSQPKATIHSGLGGFSGPQLATWMEVYSKPQSRQYYKRLFHSRKSPLLKDLYGFQK